MQKYFKYQKARPDEGERKVSFGKMHSFKSPTTGTSAPASVLGSIIPKDACIQDLLPGVLREQTLSGVIIAKQNPKSFPDKKDPGHLRWQLGLTLRDNATDFINATCWGGEDYISEINNLVRIGDVVDLRNVLIQSKPEPDPGEKYKPTTPSPFQVVVNETHGTVKHHDGNKYDELSALSNVPVRDSNDYFSLGDIIANGQILNGSHVNILVVVLKAGTSKHITTKNGRNVTRREAKICDETCQQFVLMMWDNEVILQAETWEEGLTVLFLADVKLTYDDFRKSIIATCDSKTIITTNPNTPEAHQLFTYATDNRETLLADAGDKKNQDIIDLKSITDHYTVDQLISRMNSSTQTDANTPFTGIIMACISHFDIDGPQSDQKCITYRCSQCNWRMERDAPSCTNDNCSGFQQWPVDGQISRPSFEIQVGVIDHTAGLKGVKLSGAQAEQALRQNPEQFEQLTDEERTKVKWQLLLERFKMYFKCTPPQFGKRNMPFVTLLGLEQVAIKEFIQHLKETATVA